MIKPKPVHENYWNFFAASFSPLWSQSAPMQATAKSLEKYPCPALTIYTTYDVESYAQVLNANR